MRFNSLVGLIVGQCLVELADAREAGHERRARIVLVTGIERDLDEGAHVGLDRFVALKRSGHG